MKVIQHYDNGWRVALLLDRTSTKRGREYVHVIPMTSKRIRIVRLPVDDELNFKYLDGYDLERARARFLDAGSRFGITQGALKAING